MNRIAWTEMKLIECSDRFWERTVPCHDTVTKHQPYQLKATEVQDTCGVTGKESDDDLESKLLACSFNNYAKDSFIFSISLSAAVVRETTNPKTKKFALEAFEKMILDDHLHCASVRESLEYYLFDRLPFCSWTTSFIDRYFPYKELY